MRNVRGLFARSASIAVCLLVLALALRPRAEADASSMFGGPVMSVDIEAHGWKFAPAVSAGMLRGFYAEVLPDLARTGNLNILWFELTADGTWSAWGWDEGESSNNTIGWIRTHLSDESVFEDNPRVAASAPSEPEAWIEPIRLKRGLLESHPLQVILGEQPRSAQMFSTLEQVGWGVAPLVSVMSEEDVVASDSISMQQLLTAVAARTQSLMPQLSGAAVTDPTQPILFPWDCSCSTSYGMKACGGWTLDYTTPAQSGGTNCHYWRECTTPVRSLGDYYLLCVSCTGTSTIASVELKRTLSQPGQPCVPPP